MTTRPNETKEISSFDCDHQPQGSQPDISLTTEEKLADIRASMVDYIPSQTFGRQLGRIPGWYYTEPTDTRRV